MPCSEPKYVAVETKNLGIFSTAHPCGTRCDRVEHRLNVRRRTGNNSQNFRCSSLLLKRFLEFLKQPNVLDGDDRLIRKGFEQLDLRRREGAYLGATCG